MPTLIEFFHDPQCPVTQNEVAKRAGMAPSLLSQYVNGHKQPSTRQLVRISEGIQRLGQELLAVGVCAITHRQTPATPQMYIQRKKIEKFLLSHLKPGVIYVNGPVANIIRDMSMFQVTLTDDYMVPNQPLYQLGRLQLPTLDGEEAEKRQVVVYVNPHLTFPDCTVYRADFTPIFDLNELFDMRKAL